MRLSRLTMNFGIKPVQNRTQNRGIDKFQLHLCPLHLFAISAFCIDDKEDPIHNATQ